MIGDLILEVVSNDGLEPEAITIREFNWDRNVAFWSATVRIQRQGLEYINNILYDFDDATGLITGPML